MAAWAHRCVAVVKLELFLHAHQQLAESLRQVLLLRATPLDGRAVALGCRQASTMSRGCWVE